MYKQVTSKKRAEVFSLAVFFIGLGLVSISGYWWPSIMLVIGGSLALRQLLLGKYYEMGISIFIFGGFFTTYHFDISWKVIWPVVFFTCALFVLLREYADTKLRQEDQIEEDITHEIEETATEEED